MKVLIIIIWTIFMMGFHQNLHGQSRWINLYFGNENTQGEDMKEYYDNGYLLTGKHGSGYVQFLWLIKTNVNGQVLWEKTFGEPNSLLSFYFMDVNRLGEIYLSGATSYYDPYRDPIIMKLNACGEKEWCRVFNIPNHFDYAHSIVATDDGGCAVILRYTGVPPPPQTDRICLARFAPEGNLLWKQCYNSTDTNIVNEDSRNLLITPDSGFLITATCGYLDVDSTQMYWPKQYFIKTDSFGNFEWETVVHSDNNLAGGDAWTTTLNPDSSYYYSSVSHYYFETNFSSPALIKLDLEGNVIAIYDIVIGYINGGLTYAQFINDSTLAASCVYGNSQNNIVTLSVIIDTTGNIINSINLGPNIQDKVLELTYDKKLLYFYDVLQNDQFNIYLRKMNQNLEDDTIYTMPFTYDSLCPYQILSDTIVQDDCGLIVGIEEEDKTVGKYDGKMGGMEVWPNPCREMLNVECLMLNEGKDYNLSIYDIFGRLAPIPSPSPTRGKGDSWVIDVSALPPGIYLAVLREGLSILTSTKFIIAR